MLKQYLSGKIVVSFSLKKKNVRFLNWIEIDATKIYLRLIFIVIAVDKTHDLGEEPTPHINRQQKVKIFTKHNNLEIISD